MPEPLIIFIHIPKTAGRTLRTVIRGQYRRQQICITSQTAGDPFRDYLNLPAEQKAQVRLVQGHFPYGLHEHVDGPAVYATMLRDPIARVISYYRFVRDHPEHKNHATVMANGLAGFINETQSRQLDNAQLRYLATAQDAPFGACTEAMLEQAIRRMDERFVAVGLVEAFDDSLLLMARALKWRLPVYRSINVSKHRLGDAELTDDLLDRLRDYNRLDQRLYDYARQRFEETVRAQSTRLAWDRRRLRVMNRLRAWQVHE
ncbi:MAG: sulfotransferase family 2 domain-containing protein [Caldilineales bacterium]|nr:sulfotransferase family 2 domain-containing protein [Caldilineales bacterium]MCW5860535.1 sulfotransferase family 2 domain-containing protein [Caldilineales bacterium]